MKAEQQQNEAHRQINLLLQRDTAREEGDFYPYRYLATEGFLPGHNFPALPVRAWIPHSDKGEFVSRPRFLAIREFAPRNTVYHEGAKWQVVRFCTDQIERRRQDYKLCRACGAFNSTDADVCHSCLTPLELGNSEYIQMLELPNVVTRRKERITCNEEERQRLGYLISLAYYHGNSRTLTASARLPQCQEPLELCYAPAATLPAINEGFRNNPVGFLINLESGEVDSEKGELLKIFVRDTQNILLIRGLQLDEETETSVKYAIKRGIEHIYQLEESEIEVVVVGQPGTSKRTLLLLEAAEGGLGVLRQLLRTTAWQQVIRQAIKVCHFSLDGTDLKTDCHRACYECLLSFHNEIEAPLLNRHKALPILQQLAVAQIQPHYADLSSPEHMQKLLDKTQSQLERDFLLFLQQRDYRLPDVAQFSIQDPHCIADFLYEPNILIFIDGPHHNTAYYQKVDNQLRNALQNKGYRVIVFRHHQSFDSQISRILDILR